MNDMPKLGSICWNELATADVKAAKDFYGKVFGWQFTDHEIGEMTYTMIKLNNIITDPTGAHIALWQSLGK